MKLPSWTASHVEQYCDMIWKYIFMPASLVHFELAGSLRYATDVIPSAASGDDALSAPWTVDTWLETLFRYRVGFQPSLDEPAIACAANFGVATMKKRSAPLALTAAVCELTSAPFASYDSLSTIMVLGLAPSPVVRPLT